VQHQSGTPASTVSYNLAPGVSLSQANDAIRNAMRSWACRCRFAAASAARPGLPAGAGGPALLILAAIVTIYLVLGILYENLVHPLTILSTCPRPAWARCWR
jgi:multidrug efflux pump